MLKILIFIFTLYSFGASANSCLNNASSGDLALELENRSNSLNWGDRSFFNCKSGSTLYVTWLNIYGGQSYFSIPTLHFGVCRNTAKKISDKLDNVKNSFFTPGFLFSVCSPNNKLKSFMLFSDTNLKEVSSVSTDNEEQCVRMANEINSF